MNAPQALFAGVALEGVSPGWWGLVWLAAIVAGAGFLFWTYRGIFQRSERQLTWALMLLRGAGLLLLVLALAKPTWTRESEQVDPGRVAVVLDNSRSMSLPDRTGAARYARARAALEALQKALAERKGPRVEVDLFDINGAPLREGPPPQPSVDKSDLARAVQRAIAWERSALLTGVVVISDGVDTTGRPNFSSWDDDRRPVHGLGFAETETGDLDLAVDRPTVQQRVRVHNEVPVKVRVSKEGTAAAEATLTIKRGRDVLASKKVTFGPGAGQQEVALTFTPREPGSFVLTAAVEAATGERKLANNAQHFPLRVDAEPIRVLYLEGFLRYEYKYLKTHFEDDPDVELTSRVRRESPEGAAAADRGLPPDAALKQLDVVILGDMEAGLLAGAEYQRLLRWLDGKNHSLLVLGGYHALGPDGLARTPLADVLPVTPAEAPPYQSEESFRLRLTAEGQRHPLFSLTRDPVKDAATWNEAPLLQGQALVGRLKPDAVELAVNPKVQQGGKPAPVLVARRAGGGHVMVLTADTTWRWSRVPRLMGQPDTLYAKFWSQAVRWLAGRSLDDDRPLLSVSTDQPSYDAGKRVTVTVRRQPRPGTDLANAEAAVEVRDPAGRVLPLTLKGDSAEPDKSTAEFFPSVGGRYEVAATLTGGGKPLANQAAEFQVQGVDVEMADVGTNPQTLRDLAAATGGVYLDVDRAAELADKIDRRERRTVTERRTEYWNSVWLFTGFLALVSGEWFLRRRNHLV
jgi:hypothetical protein